MNQKITGYHKDHEDHWVAELECGHSQHVRHDPPWMEREWVTTAEGRSANSGRKLECVRCDEMGLQIAEAVVKECRRTVIAAYTDAGMGGLCEDGRWEAALGSLQGIDAKKVLETALKISEE